MAVHYKENSNSNKKQTQESNDQLRATRKSVVETSVGKQAVRNIQKGGNMTQNQIAYQNLIETGRANRAREAEAHRAATATEAIRVLELGETSRANQARELETNRSNLAREFETHRANVVSESLKSAELGLRSDELRASYAKLMNEAQHNREMEVITRDHYERSDESQRLNSLNNYATLHYQNALKERELDLREQQMWVQLGADVGRTGASVVNTLLKKRR